MRNLFLIVLIVASLLILAGVLAKVQHWPLANWLMGAGLLLELVSGAGFAILAWRSRRAG